MSTDGDRLDELAERLARIEAFLATHGFQKPADPPAVMPILDRPPEAATVSERAAALVNTLEELKRDSRARRVPSEVGAVPPVIVDAHVEPKPPPLPQPLPERSQAIPIAEFVEPEPLRMSQLRPTPSAHAPASGTLEQAIGLKLAGWVGALVLVIGGAMGVKYAYDQGWLGGMPDEVKLGLLYAVGIAIVGAGEYVHRRVNPLAAVGLFGAGIAMLFVVGYAGNAYYDLYARHTAFGLMAGACAVGFIIALRGRLVSIAVLSLIGANVAPLVLREAATGEAALLIYLLVLQVLSLSLAFVGREQRWWALRTLSLVTTGLWIAGRLLDPVTAHSTLTIQFAALYALIFQIEAALSAWLRPTGWTGPSRWGDRATFSFAVTGFLTTTWLIWSRDLSTQPRATAMAGLAVTLAAAALIVRRSRNVPPDLGQLALSWYVQAGTLLFAVMPVALAGPWLVLGWTALALGYAVLGRLTGHRGTTVAGTLVWLVAAFWLAVTASQASARSPIRQPLLTVGDVPLPVWFAIALLLAAVGHAIGCLLKPRPRDGQTEPVSGEREVDTFGDGVSVFATAGAVAAIFAALPGNVGMLALVAVAWLLLGFGRAVRRDVYGWLTLAVVGLAVGKWVAVDVMVERLSAGGWSPQARTPFFNAMIGTGVAVVGSAVTIAWLAGRWMFGPGQRRDEVRLLLTTAAIVLLTAGLTVEVERSVRLAGASVWPPRQLIQMSWSVLWLVAALSVAVMPRLLRVADPLIRTRVAAVVVGVIALLSIKFLTVDSLLFALSEPRVPAMPLVNAQTTVAVVVLASLLIAWRITRGQPVASLARGLVPLVPLVIGSLELDRMIGPGKTLVGLSIFWGLYAIATIVAGFAARSKSFRIGGLGLLGLTLAKVILLDLAQAGTGLRILSFLGVGAILLITSVLYGKLSPIVLERIAEARERNPSRR